MNQFNQTMMQSVTGYTQVTDGQALAELCRHWQQRPFLAFDTEFIRTNTFYPKMALIQVCDGSANFLIDPLSIGQWEEFKALIINPEVTKVFHSCSEDLLVFLSFLGVVPSPVFDTQIASALLNEGFGLSYQNLVRQKTGLELPKGETRSDWLQRPLTPEQLDYAALDVAYLPEIYQLLQALLEKQGKSDWMREEGERLTHGCDAEIKADFSDYYLNFKNAWQLNRVQLAALQKLVIWREEKARKRDRPKSWIIDDQQVFAIARNRPETLQQLSAIAGLSPKFLKHEGEALLQLLQAVAGMPESALPALTRQPLSAGQKKKLKAAQSYIEEKAAVLTMAPELLARKKTLLALLYSCLDAKARLGTIPDSEQITIPEDLQGWRRPVIVADLLAIFAA
ncbi:MAG: ribonuclease D [Pseudomonadales bacterium]|nr:ribonuclease D [Pseudomonadales bacterium]